MNLTKASQKIIKVTTLVIFTGNLLGSIIDPDIAPNITLSQEAWLTGRLDSAFILYLTELDTAIYTKPIIYYNLAYLSYLKGDTEKTTFFIEKSLSENKNFGPALFLYGLLQLKRNDFSKALRLLSKASIHYSFREYPEYYLGLIQLKKGEPLKALRHFKKALRLNKKFTRTYPQMAKTYLLLGDTAKAENVLLDGLSHSYDAEILLSLGDLYSSLGNERKAKKYYGLFAYFFPYHPSYQRVAEWLNSHGVENPYTTDFSPPPERNPEDRFFPIGEEKLYNVFFGPIKSGELYTKIADTLNFNGIDVYKVYFSIDSNPALAFIATVHSDYITYLDQNSKLAVRHFLHTRENKIINEKIYDFDRKNGKFICRVVQKDGHIQYIEKWLPRYTTDGTSILFYARQLVKEKRSERVMTIIDENFVVSDINFTGKFEPVEHNDTAEMGILITGKNHYKGILGFTGNFRGWFRNNHTYLPIQADFEIWVGRILIKMGSQLELKLRKFAR